MPNTKTVDVAHLGGNDAGYQMPHPYGPAKPTLVLVNSFATSSGLYRGQHANKQLTEKMNLLAIEFLGHGKTRTKNENFTYWDTAIMNLQVMEALGVKKAFVLSTSQGGWITVRMALLVPDRDGVAACTGPINEWTTNEAAHNFEPSLDYCNFLIDIDFGKNCPDETRQFWQKTIQTNYQGEDGRRWARMAAINLRERDGWHGRLSDVKCPVMWLHGTDDVVYSIANAEEEIKLFKNAKAAGLVTVPGSAHFLSASHPKEIDITLIEFVGKWAR